MSQESRGRRLAKLWLQKFRDLLQACERAGVRVDLRLVAAAAGVGRELDGRRQRAAQRRARRRRLLQAPPLGVVVDHAGEVQRLAPLPHHSAPAFLLLLDDDDDEIAFFPPPPPRNGTMARDENDAAIPSRGRRCSRRAARDSRLAHVPISAATACAMLIPIAAAASSSPPRALASAPRP
uniref:Uncharacterized protein n=1 Tax=Oryza meridionalis TaxID=40149 RepID=A0A0E0CQJ2_9ORYZ